MLKRTAPRRRARRQEPGEQENVGGKPRQDQRRQRSRRPGRGGYRQVLCQHRAYQLEPGVGDQRRSGIRNQRHLLAAAQRLQHRRAHPIGVVVVIGIERRIDAEPGEQPRGHSRIFAEDAIDVAQYP